MRQAVFLVVWFMASVNWADIPLLGKPWPPPWQRFEVACEANVVAMALMPSERELIALLEDGGLLVIDCGTGRVVRRSENVLPGKVKHLMRVSALGDRAVVFGPKALYLIGLSTLEMCEAVPMPGVAGSIDLSPDGKRIALTISSGKIIFVELAHEPVVAEFDASRFGRSFPWVVWMPDGQHCLLGGWGEETWVVDAKKRQPVCPLLLGRRREAPFLTADRSWLVALNDDMGRAGQATQFFSVGEVMRRIESGGGSVTPRYVVNIPRGFYQALLRDVPLEQWRFAGLRGFDPARPAYLPIVCDGPTKPAISLALADGRILFAARDRHLCCWNGSVVDPGGQSVLSDLGNEDCEKAFWWRRGDVRLNLGNSFSWGGRRCLALLKASPQGELGAPRVEFVETHETDPFRTIELPPMVGDVELHPSDDGRCIAVTTEIPGRSFSVPIEEILRNPGLAMTAVTMSPSVLVLRADSDEIITDDAWRATKASLVRFDPESRRMISFGAKDDSVQQAVLFDLVERKVVAKGDFSLGNEFDAQLFSDGRLAIYSAGDLAVYSLFDGSWVRGPSRGGLDADQAKLLALLRGGLLLYSQVGAGRVLSDQTLADQGWIFPSLYARGSIIRYWAERAGTNQIRCFAAETIESFQVPTDIAPVATVIPVSRGCAYRLDVGPDAACFVAAVPKQFCLIDYDSGRVVNSVRVDPRRDITTEIVSLGPKQFAAKGLDGGWEAWDLSGKPRRLGVWEGIQPGLVPRMGQDKAIKFETRIVPESRYRVDGGGSDPVFVRDLKAIPSAREILIPDKGAGGIQHWVQIPGEDLVAYVAGDRLWLMDICTRRAVWSWVIPLDCQALIYSEPRAELVTSHFGAIRRWRIPNASKGN